MCIKWQNLVYRLMPSSKDTALTCKTSHSNTKKHTSNFALGKQKYQFNSKKYIYTYIYISLCPGS